MFYRDHERDGLSKIVHDALYKKSIVASDCKRDFLPVDVACKLLNKLCGNTRWYNRTVNLASGRIVNMMEIAGFLVRKYGVSCHRTTLPQYSDICYRFSPNDANSLEKINFDIFDLVEEYYENLEREMYGKTA